MNIWKSSVEKKVFFPLKNQMCTSVSICPLKLIKTSPVIRLLIKGICHVANFVPVYNLYSLWKMGDYTWKLHRLLSLKHFSAYDHYSPLNQVYHLFSKLKVKGKYWILRILSWSPYTLLYSLPGVCLGWTRSLMVSGGINIVQSISCYPVVFNTSIYSLDYSSSL